jgi:ribonuclease BN (tRNA processing enzyme)
MRVHIVGSSGTFPTFGQPASGYIVEHAGTRVWCDAGPGTFISLPVEPDLIDAVVISHQHPDHCSDIFAAYHAWTFRPEPRESVPLYAPQSVWDRMVGFIDREPSCFEFRPVWTGDRVDCGRMTVEFVEMDHSVPTVGSRWEGHNRVLFYTADTGPAGNWRELAIGASLVLSEASYQGPTGDKEYPHHLTATEAGSIARGRSGATSTHIPPSSTKRYRWLRRSRRSTARFVWPSRVRVSTSDTRR